MESSRNNSEAIVANDGWIGVKVRCRPKTERFQMLALLWSFPSVGAAVILGLNHSDWSQARGFLQNLAAVGIEQWTAAAVLLAHLIFGWLAWHYRRTEPEREVTFREPNPDQDLHKLR